MGNENQIDDVASEVTRSMMSGLSQELQQLVKAERIASRPTFADSERVFRRIQANLGSTVGASGIATIPSFTEVTTHPLIAKRIIRAVAGLGLVVAGIALMRSPAPGAATSHGTSIGDAAKDAGASTEVSAATTTNQPQDLTHQATTVTVATPQSTSATTLSSARGMARGRDTLSEEVAILSRAEKELLSGRASRALSLLNEHERKYRNGVLTEERIAARIQALCALGRVTEADSQLLKLSPQSLHNGPTRQACVTSKVAPGAR
jgi:hypothetical protein